MKTIEDLLTAINSWLEQCSEPRFVSNHGLQFKSILQILKRQLEPMEENLEDFSDYLKRNPSEAFLRSSSEFRTAAQFAVARVIVSGLDQALDDPEQDVRAYLQDMVSGEVIRNGLRNKNTDPVHNEMKDNVTWMWIWWFRYLREGVES